MIKRYKFDAAKEVEKISKHMRKYFSYSDNPTICVGISGGVDSSVSAAIAAREFGSKNIYGIMLPCGKQSDIDCSEQLISHLGINRRMINIGDAYEALSKAVNDSEFAAGVNDTDCKDCYQYKTNTPARLRMSAIYGLAALKHGNMLNTSNTSENCVGFDTIYGDHAGGYSCLDSYTKTEVRAMGKYLGLPDNLVNKTPTDGMCGSSDEEKISEITGIKNFTYERFDKLIRRQKHDFTKADIEALVDLYNKNVFKLNIVQIPHYEPGFPNFFTKKTLFERIAFLFKKVK